MKFYTSDGFSYEGMSQETIIQLRTELGRETELVDQVTYETYVLAHQPTRR